MHAHNPMHEMIPNLTKVLPSALKNMQHLSAVHHSLEQAVRTEPMKKMVTKNSDVVHVGRGGGGNKHRCEEYFFERIPTIELMNSKRVHSRCPQKIKNDLPAVATQGNGIPLQRSFTQCPWPSHAYVLVAKCETISHALESALNSRRAKGGH